jgi:hypothetical protein
VSGAPRGRGSELASLGNSQRRSAIIHRTVRCTPDCPVYTGLPGVHRTVRCICRAMATSAPTVTCRRSVGAFNARQSAQKSGTREHAHRTFYSSCPVRHRSSRRARRQSSNGWNPNVRVAWLAHRTCPVYTGLSGAPYDRQPPPKRLVWWLGL